MSGSFWKSIKGAIGTKRKIANNSHALSQVAIDDTNGSVAIGNVVHQNVTNMYSDGSRGPTFLEPTAAEIEILIRLFRSSIPNINAFNSVAGYQVLVNCNPLCPLGASQGSALLFEAICRLHHHGLIHNMQNDNELFQLSSAGRKAASSMIEQLKEFGHADYVAIQSTMPKLFSEFKADYDNYPINREVELVDDENSNADNSDAFRYFRNIHVDLDALFDSLESQNCVKRLPSSSHPRYRFTENFISYLRDM